MPDQQSLEDFVLVRSVQVHPEVSKVMDRYNALAPIPVRKEVVRAVKHIDAIAPQDRREAPLPPERGVLARPANWDGDRSPGVRKDTSGVHCDSAAFPKS
jgi:hypothetical protein